MSVELWEFASRYAAMCEGELMELARSYDSPVAPAQAPVLILAMG